MNLLQSIRAAIADPGAYTPRGDNYNESIPSWSARAVGIVLAQNKSEEIAFLEKERDEFRDSSQHWQAEWKNLDDALSISSCDMERMDWMEKHGIPASVIMAHNDRKPLRDAIDAAMKGAQ